MPCSIASIHELIWAKDRGLPVPKRVLFEYATKEDADRANAILKGESGLQDYVETLKYGPAPGPYLNNGMEYVVTYAGQNEPIA